MNSCRILVIDDNPSIHDDFRKTLCGSDVEHSALDSKHELLFGTDKPVRDSLKFEIDAAHQGEEGLDRIVQARQEGRPFQLAFVDIRMPPGWDGVETIEHIWTADPDVQLVICSAYSDYSAGDIVARLGFSDRLLMLRKPCDAVEIQLMATALCRKWQLAQMMQMA